MAELYLGLISGTSADAIDAALVDFDGAVDVLATDAYPLDERHRRQLLETDGRVHPADMLQLDAALGEAFAHAALALLNKANVAPESIQAIGSHGQTLWHAADNPMPSTLQIADANRIAEITGVTTVADFRRRDMAAGGQGAPLAPAFHAAVFTAPAEHRGVLNLGGIANLTVLPAGAAAPVSGFDTGPASTLLDAWHRRHRQGPYDADGSWAASGRCDESLLQALLAKPYFRQRPPKSTGPEQFNLAWLDTHLQQHPGLAPVDVQATLMELTARSVADAVVSAEPTIERLLVCGGGLHNTALMERLQQLLPRIPVNATSEYGISPDFVEAVAFAWLARQTLHGAVGNLPSVTGARGPRVLGAIFPGQARTT